MSQPVRVRFAPSPTGYLHVGNIRSAVFNYLYARKYHGAFILRIEDTDRERLVSDSLDQIIDSLAWLGLTPDEGPRQANPQFGPYVQSERLELYHRYAKQMLNKSLLYEDFTQPEELDRRRKVAQLAKQPFRFTRDMASRKPADPSHKPVLRFAIPEGDDVVWEDAVWGTQRWQRSVLDDFVAIKSDGYPTYHFANVIDDHLMAISHVIRASEWLSSTAKHLLLYQALGWPAPTLAHLPLVQGPGNSKLSKRHGAKSVLEYRDAGYLPEAMVNFLASLGFNDGTTQEIYTVDELISAFSLDRLQSSPAVFDRERLDWMNGVYIRQLSPEELGERCRAFWPPEAAEATEGYKLQVLGLVHERLKFLGELPELTDFFFVDPIVDSELMTKNYDPRRAAELLEGVTAQLDASDFSEADLEDRLRKYVGQSETKTGQLFSLIRVAVTGKTAAPGLFETLHVLGSKSTLRRLEKAGSVLKG